MDLLSCLVYVFSLCASIFLMTLFRSVKSSHSKVLPPGPTPLPIVGNLLHLLPNISKPHQLFAELARTHGPIMTLKLGSVTTIVISSPATAKKFLKNNLISTTPFVLDASRAHEHHKFSIGSLPATSPMWRTLRKIWCTRILGDKILDAMQTQRYRKLEELLNCIAKCAIERVSIDVGQIAYDASFNIMSNMVFSTDLTTDDRIREIKELMDRIIEELGRPNVADCYPALKLIDPQRIRHRLTVLCTKLFNVFDDIIDERMKSKEGQMKSLGSHGDLLDVILDVMEEQKFEISLDHVHHLLLDILGAGTDTTSKTVERAMTELLRNRGVLLKCQEEIDRVLGKRGKVQESNISQLPYLCAVVKETLRLHPSAPLLLPRTIEQDTEISGFTLPKGAQVILNVWAIGRDTHTWVDPDLFFPDRFLGSEVDVKGQHFELIPFGSGRKMCPGLPLAMRMVYLVLGSLISSFDWKLENFSKDLEDMDDMFGITIEKAKALRAFPIRRA